MIETIVIDFLSKTLNVEVSGEVIAGRKGAFVVVEKTGGGKIEQIDTAIVVVQSYGDTMLAAAELNTRVKAAMQGITSLPSISACEVNTDYNFTDTSKKKYRYQAVFDLVYYS